MEKAKRLCALMVLFALLLSRVQTLQAVQMQPVSRADERHALQVMELNRIEEPMHSTMLCLAVNEKGGYALGYPGLIYKTVSVYDAQNRFLKRYDFKCEGDYGIQLDEAHLHIYLMKSNLVVSVSLDTDEANVHEYESSYEWMRTLHADTVRIGEETYELRTEPLLLSLFANDCHAKLVKVDGEGVETVLQDASGLLVPQAVFGVVIAVLLTAGTAAFVIFLIVKCVKYPKQMKKKEDI